VELGCTNRYHNLLLGRIQIKEKDKTEYKTEDNIADRTEDKTEDKRIKQRTI